ncbi:MAG: hypothetical protein WDN28_22430 [Chthoniobacter sp.]
MILIGRVDQSALGGEEFHRFVFRADQFALDLLQMIPVGARLAVMTADAGVDQRRSSSR